MQKIIFISVFFFFNVLHAATYTFPADLTSPPFNCSGSGGSYSCSNDLSFSNNDILNITTSITITVDDDFRANNNFTINTSGNTLNLILLDDFIVGGNFSASATVNIDANDDVSIGNGVDFTGNITAGDDVSIGNNGTITGDITAADNLNIGNNTVVNGVCDPTHFRCTGISNTPLVPIANYYFDECEWDGTADEVQDSSTGGYHGTARNGANTIDDGQVCTRSGSFDGSDDYIEQNNVFNTLRTTASLSFWIKTSQNGNNTAWRAPGVTGIEESGGTNDIFWGWLDAAGHIGIQKGDTAGAQSSTVVNDNSWHHVVLTRDSGSGVSQVYIDGSLEDTATSAAGDVGNSFNRIGSIIDTGGTPTYFEGYLDEFKMYDGVLGSSQVQEIYDNESVGKNYDGSIRTCDPCGAACGSYPGTLDRIQFVGDQFTLNDTYSTPFMTHVTYKDNYVFSENPVIFVLPNTNGNHPANMRIKNVDSRGFDIAMVEPQGEDGAHIAMTVDYFAVNVGDTTANSASQVYALGNHIIEVGYIKTTKQQKGYDVGTNEWETITPKGNFCNPVIVTQIQGMVNEPSYDPTQPSEPFLSTAAEIDGTDIKLALDRSETNTGTVSQPEMIAYMISEANYQDSFIDDVGRTVVFETIQTGKIFYGWDDSAVSTSFINTYPAVPLVAASLNSRDSLDGGWFRKSNHTQTQIALKIDEDRWRSTSANGAGSVQDRERSKYRNDATGDLVTPESAGIFVFDGTFIKTGGQTFGNLNAVNVAEKDIFEGNIATQIAGSVLDLALVAREDDNVTKRDANISKIEIVNCVDDLCLDCEITTDATTIFDNPAAPVEISASVGYTLLSAAGVNYTLPEARKIQKIRMTEVGKPVACSFDTFAVRPQRYSISTSSATYAGENFLLNFRAPDANGVNTLSYNESESNSSFVVDYLETRPECNFGEVLSHNTVSFSDGAALNIDANYTGIAQFLNISIAENNGSEFARIDNDDTPDALRLITPHEINISVLPYELNVTATQIQASTGTDWLYMASLKDMNLSSAVTIQANNKNHDVLKDFNASCYAQNVDFDFDMTVFDGDNTLDMNYTASRGILLSMGTTLGDIDQSMRIPASDFIDGVAQGVLALNVDRSYAAPVAPFKVIGLGATITSAGVAKVINNDTTLSDGNFTFYYARLKADDIVTTSLPVSNTAYFEVFDDTNSVYTAGMKQNSLFWHINNLHANNAEGDIIEAIASSNTLIDNALGGFSFSYGPVSTGQQDLDITAASEAKGVIHLKTQEWLWYVPSGFGSAYDDGTGTDCTMHPCFKFSLTPNNSALMIKSGDFNGTAVPDVNRSDYIQKGVKLFR